jgi:hypothetical protein
MTPAGPPREGVTAVRRPLVAFMLAFLFAAPVGTAWAQETSLVTIVHGLPRFVADVYVNGDLLLDGFRPRDLTQPLELPAGEYHVEIRDVGASPDSDPALEDTLSLDAGLNVSVIAHLTSEGTPALSVFNNDVARVPAGRSRLLVRHGADAPAVDVDVDGSERFAGITSDQQAGGILPPGGHTLAVRSASDGQMLLRGRKVNLEEGTATFVYLIGSAEERTLGLMVQTMEDVQSPPSGVPSGDGGLAARSPALKWRWAVLVTAFVALGLSITIPRRRTIR